MIHEQTISRPVLLVENTAKNQPHFQKGYFSYQDWKRLYTLMGLKYEKKKLDLTLSEYPVGERKTSRMGQTRCALDKLCSQDHTHRRQRNEQRDLD